MSTQRYISTSFWDDEWVHHLDPSEKLLYMYFLTNPLTNIAGVYKLSLSRISYDTGFNENSINHIMDKFEKAGKACRIGEYIALPSWPKHQKWETRSKIRDGIISCLQEIPNEALLRLADIGYKFDLRAVDSTIIARKQRREISGTTVKAVKEKYHNKCAICGGIESLNIHHIIPIKHGGDNSFENLELLCLECHQKEHGSESEQRDEIQSTYDTNYSDSEFDSEFEFDSENTEQQSQPVSNQPEETPSVATANAVAAVQSTSISKNEKKKLTEQELSLYHEIERWFMSKPESAALMHKDRSASSRTGKALKTIVERCFNHAKQYGGEAIAIARPMVGMFHKAIYEKAGRDKLRVTFTPVGLATEWVWDTIYMQCKSYVEAGSHEVVSQNIQESLMRKQEVIRKGGVEI